MFKFEGLREGGELPARVRIPGKDEAHAAMLCYSPDEGVSMSLIDIQANFIDAFSADVMGECDRPEVIHGELPGGCPFTLLGCFKRPGLHGANGIGHSTYSAGSLVAGWHVESDQVPCVKSVELSLTMLDVWMTNTYTVQSRDPDVRKGVTGKGIRATACFVDQFEHYAKETGIALRSHQTIGFGKTDPAVTTINNRSSLMLKFDNPVTISAAKEELYRLQCLFSLLCGIQSHPTTIVLRPEKDNELGLDRQAYVLGGYAYKSRDSIVIPDQLLTHQRMVEPYLAEIWAEWQRNIDIYSVPVELHASTSVFGDQLAQFEYLSAVQALEVLHRRKIPQAGKRRTPLLDRLESLCEGLSDPLKEALHPRLTKLLEKVKDTRDELTHSLGHPPEKIFAREELHAAALWLRWVFTVWMLHALGLPADVLAKTLGEERQLKRLRDIVL
ncbi:MAG: HEPN domain-containing protein [Phycisphaerales bacterium JB050]